MLSLKGSAKGNQQTLTHKPPKTSGHASKKTPHTHTQTNAHKQKKNIHGDHTKLNKWAMIVLLQPRARKVVQYKGMNQTSTETKSKQNHSYISHRCPLKHRQNLLQWKPPPQKRSKTNWTNQPTNPPTNQPPYTNYIKLRSSVAEVLSLRRVWSICSWVLNRPPSASPTQAVWYCVETSRSVMMITSKGRTQELGRLGGGKGRKYWETHLEKTRVGKWIINMSGRDSVVFLWFWWGFGGRGNFFSSKMSEKTHIVGQEWFRRC